MQIALGHVPDCRPHVTNMSLARWWRLYRGLGALLKRNAVTGATVERFSVCALLSLCAVVICSRSFDNLQVCSVESSEPHTVVRRIRSVMVESCASGRKRYCCNSCHRSRAERGICWLHDKISRRTLPRCRCGGIADRLRYTHEPL